MSETIAPDPAVREDFIRSSWLSHDAHWFTAVAASCGIDIANRVNREAIREAGAAEPRRLHRLLGLAPARSVEDIIAFMDAGGELVVGDLVELTVTPVDDSSYQVEVTRCFAADNIGRAGLAEVYQCGIFDRVHRSRPPAC